MSEHYADNIVNFGAFEIAQKKSAMAAVAII